MSLARWIWSENVDRRHLTKDQIAAAITALRAFEEREAARKRQATSAPGIYGGKPLGEKSPQAVKSPETQDRIPDLGGVVTAARDRQVAALKQGGAPTIASVGEKPPQRTNPLKTQDRVPDLGGAVTAAPKAPGRVREHLVKESGASVLARGVAHGPRAGSVATRWATRTPAR
jgi:hypothetical protein